MRRFGQMILIKPENVEAYKYHHANPLPGLNDIMKACGLQNYSIYQRGEYLFASYEYAGVDFDADMARLSADPINQKWCELVMPLMQPLPDKKEGEFWSGMEEIYHLD